jgi:hypothetical protein
MVVSDRCRGVNLLNHLRQLKKPVSVKFFRLKDIEDRTQLIGKIINIDDYKKNHGNWVNYLDKQLWICTLTIGCETHFAIGTQKKMVLNYLLREKHEDLTQLQTSEKRCSPEQHQETFLMLHTLFGA